MIAPFIGTTLIIMVPPTPGASILDGPWKLIEFYEWTAELYHLDNDPGEHTGI